MDGDLSVEFLFSEDCPSHQRALSLLREVLKAEGVRAQLTITQIETLAGAEQHRFPGSPTIRINGVDIDSQPEMPVALACRAYQQADGRISPLPARQTIVDAIHAALQRPDQSGAVSTPWRTS